MEKDNFFGDATYEIPETSNYMKFKDGENKFRVLSSAITGWEYWNNQNKPIRNKDTWATVPDDIREDSDIKHFWAFFVYNYEAKKVQILQITQKGIMKYIKSLTANPKWGNPKGYDITVTKSGSGMSTEYTYIADPHSELDSKIKDQFSKMKVDLSLLYAGGDPFTPEK